MSKWDKINRRNFIGTTAAAVVGGAAASSADTKTAETTPQKAPRAFRSAAGSFIPYSKEELLRKLEFAEQSVVVSA